MSDGELRDLERRWRSSGTTEDEARWHVARVRAGALEPAKLGLAAWTGWPAAVLAAQDEAAVAGTTSWVRRLFGGASRPDPTAPLTGGLPALARWLDAGLRDAPIDVQRRAALVEVERAVKHLLYARARRGAELRVATKRAAAGHGLLVSVQADESDPGMAWLRAAHAVLRDAAHAATQALLGGQAIEPPPRLEWLDGPPRELELLGAAWLATIQAACAAGRPARVGKAQGWWASYAGRGARRFTGADAQAWAEEVRAAQRASLAPWALGLADPLRDRAASALDALEVASPCAASWDRMQPVDAAGRVRACDQCQQRVHDLSALSRPEAEALLAEHAGQRLCVRLYRRADGRVQTRDCAAGIDALVDQGAPRHMILGRVAAPTDPT